MCKGNEGNEGNKGNDEVICTLKFKDAHINVIRYKKEEMLRLVQIFISDKRSDNERNNSPKVYYGLGVLNIHDEVLISLHITDKSLYKETKNRCIEEAKKNK